MELITQSRTWPRGERRPPSLTIPLCLLVVFIGLVGFTVTNLAAMALAASSSPVSNPFSAYQGVFPGQPRSAVIAQGFTCAMDTHPILPDEYCRLNPAAGVFSQVGVVVSKGLVWQLDFTLRENTLSAGDLVFLWGNPQNNRAYGRVRRFAWRIDDLTLFTLLDTERLSYLIPVRYVSVALPKGRICGRAPSYPVQLR